MARVPLYMAGRVGIIKDIDSHELPPLAWSDGRNVRFKDGKLVRPNAPAQIFGDTLGDAYWLMPVFTTLNAYWVYSSLTKLYATDGGLHADVTRAVGGDYTVKKNDKWNGGLLGNIPVISNGTDVPQAWMAPALGNQFEDLANWPAGDRVRVIKPFKSFLVGAGLTRGGVFYPHVVKWSHPATIGNVPPSWDETNPTLQAGEVEILDDKPGQIRDALGLRDTFIIYKDNTTWGMQFIGGNSIFRFYPILAQSGILTNNCVCAIANGTQHFVATGDDVIVHDGQGTKSVLGRKLRSWWQNNLAEGVSDRSYVALDSFKKEAWLFWPSHGADAPNMAFVYNYEEDIVQIREFSNEYRHVVSGTIGSGTEPWDEDSDSWDSDTTPWDKLTFSAHFFSLVGANRMQNRLDAIEAESVYGEGYVERRGLAVSGQDRVTGEIKSDPTTRRLVTRIWPRVRGAPIRVSIGAQEDIDGPIVWLPFQTFTPLQQKYLDFVIGGKLNAVRFEWVDAEANDCEIDGYDLDVSPLGDH